MEDLLAKMQEILGSPEGQEQLKSVAQMLGGDSGQLPDLSQLGNLFGNAEQVSAPPPATPAPAASTGFDLSGIDMNMIMQVQKVLSSMNHEDENTKLLLALKPHFGEKRQEKIDQAIKMLRLLSVLPLLRQSGILGGLFGDATK